MSGSYTRASSIFTKSANAAQKAKRSVKKRPPPPPPLPPTPPPPSNPPAKPTTTRKVLSAQLRRLKLEVKEFIKLSESARFRKRYLFYSDTVRRFFHANQPSMIHEVLDHQKRYEDIKHEPFTVSLITQYGKSGMFDHAYKLFDEMPDLKCQRTVLSLNAILAACISSKELGKFEDLFNELPGKLSVEPDVITYNTVTKAFCEMGSLDKAVSVLDQMEEKGLNPNSVSYNTLLDQLYRNGRSADGEKIWELMKTKNVDPDIRSYNSKLRGLVAEERLSEAVELFDELKANNLKPDVYSFNPLIKGFCSAGNVKKVKEWFGKLLESKCKPDGITIRTILPFLCSNGEAIMALDICKKTIGRRYVVDTELFQLVVNELVSESKMEEAVELVKLGRSNDHFCYKLELNLNK